MEVSFISIFRNSALSFFGGNGTKCQYINPYSDEPRNKGELLADAHFAFIINVSPSGLFKGLVCKQKSGRNGKRRGEK